LAIRRRKIAREVVGFGRRMETLDVALSRMAVDRVTTDLAEAVKSADLAILCTPVDLIPLFAAEIAKLRGHEILITDAGSTKAGVIECIRKEARKRTSKNTKNMELEPRFVGGHPLAGDHNTGPEHARANLFDDRLVIVTPTRNNRKADVADVCEFWRRLGARVETMSPARHDRLLSSASHAPHLVAAAVSAATPQGTLPLVGTGWKDTTRIASGDTHMWRQIALANRENIVEDLRRIESAVESMRTALESGDGRRLEAILRKAKRNRDAVGS
jgi:prephenate dehydrogenase